MTQELTTELTYEQKQKLKWKNIKRNWSLLSDEERGEVAYQLLHTAYTWVPKQLIYDVFRWLVEGVQNERFDILTLTEKKRSQLKLVEA